MSDYLLSSTHSHLLTLEDDHWGHTEQMLDDLLNANSDVSAIGYYSRWPHYPLTLQNKMNNGKYLECVCEDKQEVDLCGFGMTLIRREVLEKLDKPTFRLNNTNERNVGTDRNFCERVKQAGFKITGIFNHDLVHDGISKNNIVQKRMKFWDSTNIHGSRPRRTRHILSQQ